MFEEGNMKNGIIIILIVFAIGFIDMVVISLLRRR
jgi:hypothetical protein